MSISYITISFIIGFALGFVLFPAYMHIRYRKHIKKAREITNSLFENIEQPEGHKEEIKNGMEKLIVIADEHAHPCTLRNIEHRVLVTGRHVLADETVNLPMRGNPSIRHSHDISIIKLPVFGSFDKSGADRHVVSCC